MEQDELQSIIEEEEWVDEKRVEKRVLKKLRKNEKMKNEKFYLKEKTKVR